MSWNPPSTQPAFAPPRVVFGYRSELMRYLTPVILSAFAIAAPLILIDAVFRDTPLLFAVFFNAVVVWNTYWFAWRIGWSIEVDGDTVEWRTVLRRRTLRLDDLVGGSELAELWSENTAEVAGWRATLADIEQRLGE